MKTKLTIALLFITLFSFAQKSTDNSNKNGTNTSKAIYVKIDDIKGESKDKSSKRTIKIGGVEKPDARSRETSSSNSERICNNDLIAERSRITRVYNKRKFSNQHKTGLVVEGAITNTNARRRSDVTMKDVTLDKQQKSTKRRRVIVAKSNKQGDPDASKK